MHAVYVTDKTLHHKLVAIYILGLNFYENNVKTLYDIRCYAPTYFSQYKEKQIPLSFSYS